jgi:hypothetical protein
VADVFDPSGQPVSVPDLQVRDLFLAKKIGFAPGQQVPVSLGDKFGYVPAESAQDAFTKGWSFDPEGVTKAEQQAKYGTPGQQAIAGVEGLARGALTGPVATEGEKALLGVPAEDIQGRQEANPGTAGATELVGAVAPSMLGDEESVIGLPGAAGDLMRAMPAYGIGKLGEAAEGAIGAKTALGAIGSGVVQTAAFGATDELNRQMLEGDPADIPARAQKILSAAGTSALLGGGVSGIFHLTGALAAGAIGKSGRALESTLDAFSASGKAKGAAAAGTMASVVDQLGNRVEADPTTFVGKLLDAIMGKDERAAIGRLADRSTRDLARTAQSDVDGQMIGGAQALGAHMDLLEAKMKAVRDAIKPAEIQAGLQNVDPTNLRRSIFELVTQIRGRVTDMSARPADFFASSKIGQIEAQADKLEKLIGDPKLEPTAMQLFDGLNEAKQNLEKIEKLGEQIPATERPAAQAAGDFRKAIQQRLMDESLVGGAAAAQGKYNALLSDWIPAARQFFEYFGEREGYAGGKPIFKIDPKALESFLGSVGTPGAELSRQAFVQMLESSQRIADALADDPDVTAKLTSTLKTTDELARLARAQADLRKVSATAKGALGVFASPLGRAVVAGAAIHGGIVGGVAAAAGPKVGMGILHLLDQIAAKKDLEIRALARMVARGTEPIADRAPVAALKVLDMIRLSDSTHKPDKDRKAAFARVAGELRALAGNPRKAMAAMIPRLNPIAQVAPQHAMAMAKQARQMIDYLHAHLPQTPQRSPMQGYSRGAVASDADITAFAQLAKVVNNPVAALDDLAHGRLTVLQVKALAETNPQLYEQMKSEIGQAIDENRRAMPLEGRLQLAMFFNAPIEPLLSPTFIRAAQSAYGPPAPDAGAGGGAPLKSTRELKSIKMAASATQSRALDVAT